MPHSSSGLIFPPASCLRCRTCKAVNGNVTLLGSPWSPPQWMKQNNNLRDEFVDAWVGYMCRQVRIYSPLQCISWQCIYQYIYPLPAHTQPHHITTPHHPHYQAPSTATPKHLAGCQCSQHYHCCRTLIRCIASRCMGGGQRRGLQGFG